VIRQTRASLHCPLATRHAQPLCAAPSDWCASLAAIDNASGPPMRTSQAWIPAGQLSTWGGGSTLGRRVLCGGKTLLFAAIDARLLCAAPSHQVCIIHGHRQSTPLESQGKSLTRRTTVVAARGRRWFVLVCFETISFDFSGYCPRSRDTTSFDILSHHPSSSHPCVKQKRTRGTTVVAARGRRWGAPGP
jgi:hypothetical protein